MKRRDVLGIWVKLRMIIKEGKRDTLGTFKHKGYVVIQTKLPRKAGDLKGNLPYYVRQQLKLNQDQFTDIRICIKGHIDYIEILSNKGLLPA